MVHNPKCHTQVITHTRTTSKKSGGRHWPLKIMIA